MTEIKRLENLRSFCKKEAFDAERLSKSCYEDYNKGRKRVYDTMVIKLGGLLFEAEKEPKPVAGPWRTDEPPRDRPILAMWYHPKECCVIEWDFHQEEFIECGMDTYVTEPTKWAEINLRGVEHGTQNTSME